MRSNQLVEKTIGGLHSHLESKLNQIQLSSHKPILDIGCGSGAWLSRLSNLGYTNLHGIDIDRNSFQLKNVVFTEANIDYETPNLNNQFSLITAIEVIEHLENIGNFFKFVTTNLSPDGVLMITTPNIHSLTCTTRFMLTGNLSQFDSKGDIGHIYPVLLHTLHKIMARYDLTIFDTWSFPELEVTSSRLFTKIGSSFLRLFIKDNLPGDTLCLLI
jgi:2-polyprenyl-6-hydroxyphenyl methylase/3-demethylubiquinone-9 3-methyltransferase